MDYPDPHPTVPLWAVLLLVIVLAVTISAAFLSVANASDLCHPIDDLKKSHPHGDWQPLTTGQWLFLSGVYALAPTTPPGLPYGDKAILVLDPGSKDGVILFVDGDLACTPMPAPESLLKMLTDVAAGKINHEGSPL